MSYKVITTTILFVGSRLSRCMRDWVCIKVRMPGDQAVFNVSSANTVGTKEHQTFPSECYILNEFLHHLIIDYFFLMVLGYICVQVKWTYMEGVRLLRKYSILTSQTPHCVSPNIYPFYLAFSSCRKDCS